MAVPAPRSSPAKFLTALCLIVAWCLTVSAASAAYKWPAVDKAELVETKPKIDPEAGAEILFRDVELDHNDVDASADTYYVRVKIYDQRGVEAFSKIELPYDEDTRVKNIAARTIKPDGRVVELNSKEVFDTVALKSGRNVRLKVKSFAPPALEPGVIVEYTYTEIKDGPGVFMPMLFQAEHPIRRARYRVRLLNLANNPFASQLSVRFLNFNCPQQEPVADKSGYYNFEMTDLPAAKEEPFQPPAINTMSARVIYYAFQDSSKTPAEFWSKHSRKLHDELRDEAKPTKAVKAALATIVAAQDSDEEKLRKIFTYCRTKIVNRSSDAAGLTHKQREKLKTNRSVDDVLKNGIGSSKDINQLFASLALAAGFEVQWADCNDRTELYFHESLVEPAFVFPQRAVAVRLGEKWRHCDPGSTYLPYGFLNWRNTDTAILVGSRDGKTTPVMKTGPSAPESMHLRKAILALDEEGTLEGDITEDFTGYCDVKLKRMLDGMSEQEREDYVRKQLQEHQKLAELTNIKIENATAPLEPLKISYRLRIPQYADRTGTRLFVQPACFQKGAPALFEAAKRRTNILFPFCYSTRDDISIKLPAHCTIEEGSAPGNLQMGALGDYSTELRVYRKTNTLSYIRNFSLKSTLFPQPSYPAIKKAFEIIRTRDAHTLTLRLGEPAANGTPDPAAEPGTAQAKPDDSAK